MERRGLNIRKSFLRAVLPMIRALPLPVASRFVRASAGWNTGGARACAQAFSDAVRHGRSGARLSVGRRRP